MLKNFKSPFWRVFDPVTALYPAVVVRIHEIKKKHSGPDLDSGCIIGVSVGISHVIAMTSELNNASFCSVMCLFNTWFTIGLTYGADSCN